MKKIEIKVPALGESINEATIAKWFKKKGEFVDKDEVILELETDKVSQEIYALERGELSEIFFQEGEDVKIGDTVAHIELSDKYNKKDGALIKTPNNKVSSDSQKSFFFFSIPALGESISEVTIGSWLKKVGDEVFKGEALVEIETDKVTQELYSEHNGILVEILYNEDNEASIGEVIARLELKSLTKNMEIEKDEVLSNNHQKENNQISDKKELDPTTIKRSGIGNKISLLDLKEFTEELSFSPAVKRIIREKGIDTNSLNPAKGSDRVNKSDVIKDDPSNVIKNDHNSLSDEVAGDIEKPLSKLRQSIASRLKKAQNTAAMLTTFNEIDMFKVINIRKKHKDKFFEKYNVKLGFMSFFTKAVITALKEIPEINAEIKGSSIIYKNRYDIGIAVGTDKGLYVPVIRNANKMSFSEIENEIINYGKMAKENKLSVEHMRDGTFTISNGGVYGSMLSTPILNTPQSGILGLHNIVKRPWVLKEEITIRPIMYVALTYDHRIVDGKQAVTFLVRIKEMIENPEQIMFEL